jgi:hypothetical protein
MSTQAGNRANVTRYERELAEGGLGLRLKGISDASHSTTSTSSKIGTNLPVVVDK